MVLLEILESIAIAPIAYTISFFYGDVLVNRPCPGTKSHWPVPQLPGCLVNAWIPFQTSSAIGQRKYRIPSDLRSQALYRSVSTMVGDHMGILGAEVLLLFSLPFA